MQQSKIIWGIVALIFLITIAISFGPTPSYSQKESVQPAGFEDLSKYAVADYDTPEIANAVERDARRIKSKRYDNEQYFVKKKPNAETDGVIVYDAVTNPSAVPVAESDLIVSGDITTATAFLANDKGSVYTEFVFRVDEVFRADNTSKIANGSVITMDRTGGYVRYPNGQKVLYRFHGQGLPGAGGRYLVFLKADKESPNYIIVTAYELKEGKALALDTVIPSKEFTGTSDNLVQLVRTKIAALTTNEK